MEQLLKDKVALVTGAGSGIGRAIAIAYAREGASVIVSDIDEHGAQDTITMIREKGSTKTSFFKANVAKPEEAEGLAQYALKEYGALHIACNNAGIGGPAAPVGEYPIDGWDKVISINLSGVFYGMRYQIPAMLKSGGGSIVNIASILGQVGFAGSSAYVAAKHGVVGLTQNAGIEYAEQNIRVNAVGPGFITTPLLEKNLNQEQMKQIAALHPMGRMGTPEEVAELVLWLSSDKASFVTGSYYTIDGAYLAR